MPRTACLLSGFAISSLLLLAGCGGADEEFKPLDENQPEVVEEAHHHHEHGPHEGHLIELGEEEYHAELVFDPQTRKTTVYILDAAAKEAQPIEASEIELHLEQGEEETELMLQAAPLEGEADGQSSRFEAAGDALPESIKSEEDFKGHLMLDIAGKSFTGEITHDHEHEHEHEHEHGDEQDAPAPTS